MFAAYVGEVDGGQSVTTAIQKGPGDTISRTKAFYKIH